MRNATVAPGVTVGRAPGDAPDVLREVCHDLRQSIATIRALASIGVSDPDATQQRLDRIVDQCSWLSSVVDTMVAPPERRGVVDVTRLAQEAVDRARTVNPATITLHAAGSLQAWTCEVALGRILENLIDNAARAAGSGRVTVAVTTRGKTVVVTISDDGPGFGAVTSGTRLGLGIVDSLADRCGAQIRTSPGKRGGHTVEVTADAWQQAEALA